MRAFARYRQQSGLDPSQAIQTAALSAYPGVARLILDLFKHQVRSGHRRRCGRARPSRPNGVFAEIMEALQAVESLDVRPGAPPPRPPGSGDGAHQNYYQTGRGWRHPKPYISFKIKSRDLIDLPAPKPYREIFVCSPRVEGVHLRFGPVARGGLRWSDRRDDFRTEVLGLVKAQQVKNAVIVPVGAKGGFYPKQLIRGASADETRAEAVGRLQDLPLRPARHHRQPRRQGQGDPPRGGDRPRRGRRSLSRRRRRQGHRHLFRHRQRRGGRLRLLARRRFRVRAARPATTTRSWASPPRARGRR